MGEVGAVGEAEEGVVADDRTGICLQEVICY